MPRAVAAIALPLLLVGCPATGADIAISEQVIQLGDAVNDLRQEASILQQQVDSLRSVVAKQDSTIATLANLAGVGYRR